MSTPAPLAADIRIAHAQPGRPVVGGLYVHDETERVPGVAVIIGATDPDTGEAWELWAGLNPGQAIAHANEILEAADKAEGEHPTR